RISSRRRASPARIASFKSAFNRSSSDEAIVTSIGRPEIVAAPPPLGYALEQMFGRSINSGAWAVPRRRTAAASSLAGVLARTRKGRGTRSILSLPQSAPRLHGEQVTRRLNEALGVGGWSFRILRHDINADADEAWALGEIVAEVDGKCVTRQQFGSQKIKRSRSSGAPLDLGFDLKGAATDAMKKCASLLGVGLYLSRKQPPRPSAARAGGTGMHRSA